MLEASPITLLKAKRVIQIFCSGGLSQVDTYDYKPELARRAGKPFDPEGKLQFFAYKAGQLPAELLEISPTRVSRASG